MDAWPYGVSMRPLNLLAVGLLMVVLDFRVDDIDLVPDVLGWVIAALSLLRLEPHVAFKAGAATAGIAAAVSLPALVAPEGLFLGGVATAAFTVVIFATCTGVMALRPSTCRSAQRLRWTILAVTVVSLTLGYQVGDTAGGAEGDTYTVAMTAVLVLAALTGFVTVILFLGWCLLTARADRANPADPLGMLGRQD